MPTSNHELPLELVRNQPQFAPNILRTIFGADVPDDPRTTLASESYAAGDPVELRCDSTVLLGEPEAPDLGIVVESQMQYDEQKEYSWPAYMPLLRLRRKCDVTLLVFCPNESVARKCAKPIDMGHPKFRLEPLTIHPGLLPPMTDPVQAREMPEAAVYSAPAHADGPNGQEVLETAYVAFEALPDHIKLMCHDYWQAQFSDTARKTMEDLVQTKGYEWQSEFALTHRAAGEAIGEAKAVLLVLSTRGLRVPAGVRERVTSCTDTEQLEHWLQRAIVVDHAEDIFA